MSKKQLAVAAILFVFALPLINIAVNIAYSLVSQPKLIYKNVERMPAYNVNQSREGIYPALVRLHDSKGEFFCTGTVISKDYVLTAAHCLIRSGLLADNMMTEEITAISLPIGYTKKQARVVGRAAAANTRADYALIKGDYREFEKMQITLAAADLENIRGLILLCGFPWGEKSEICYANMAENMRFAQGKLFVTNMLFPGMSGGPVFDLAGQRIFAVNYGLADSGQAILSPLVGLFETLGVEVVY